MGNLLRKDLLVACTLTTPLLRSTRPYGERVSKGWGGGGWGEIKGVRLGEGGNSSSCAGFSL